MVAPPCSAARLRDAIANFGGATHFPQRQGDEGQLPDVGKEGAIRALLLTIEAHRVATVPGLGPLSQARRGRVAWSMASGEPCNGTTTCRCYSKDDDPGWPDSVEWLANFAWLFAFFCKRHQGRFCSSQGNSADATHLPRVNSAPDKCSTLESPPLQRTSARTLGSRNPPWLLRTRLAEPRPFRRSHS